MKSSHPQMQIGADDENGTPPPPLLIHAKRFAQLLMVSPATLYRMQSSGQIGPRSIAWGGCARWRLATVHQWLAESESAGRLLSRKEWDALHPQGESQNGGRNA